MQEWYTVLSRHSPDWWVCHTVGLSQMRQWLHQPGGRCPVPLEAFWCCAHESQECAGLVADDIFPLSRKWTTTVFWLASWRMVSVVSSDTGKNGGGGKWGDQFLSFGKTKEKKHLYDGLLQIDSRTRNDQIQEVGYVGWRQQFSLSDMAAEAPFQSTTGSRLQTHQQHAPDCKNNILS